MLEFFIDSTLTQTELDHLTKQMGSDTPASSEPRLPDTLWVLPIRNTVLFPGVVIPITVTRPRAIRLVKEAQEQGKPIGVIAQKNGEAEDPTSADLYTCGVMAQILKAVPLADGGVTMVVHGKNRFLVKEFTDTEPYITAHPQWSADTDGKDSEVASMLEPLRESALKILQLDATLPRDAQTALEEIADASFLIHFLSANLRFEVGYRQQLLEAGSVMERARLLSNYMDKEIQQLEVRSRIQQKVHADMDRQQRDYILRQQIKALQDELGGHEDADMESARLREQAKDKLWPKGVAERFSKELEKLQRISPQSAEYPVALNYVEFMLELPWGTHTTDQFDLDKARRILDADHFGLTKVKNRILEYLAVLTLKQDMKGPILCLCGPPGVGKTSLGRSIARALNRSYVRMSLGGVHDEAEVRGHRKTYVGAMPGKLLQHIKRAKSSNPVFILDEIDKLQSSLHGDPSSALLEALDPEQNNAFVDNYLEVEYDLSQVLFIATANSLDNVQPALRDRMEVIDISGYTVEEKEQIARKHLIPKQIEAHGLVRHPIKFDKEATLKIIGDYTSESGVRELERKIGAVMRRLARAVVMKEDIPSTVTPEYVRQALGVEIFEKENHEENAVAGVVTGLAWTRVGGEILFVESSLSRGKGKLILSGQLGGVMQESASTALSYLKSTAQSLDIDERAFQQYDLHIHVPAGAIPKDGPSAGITMFTALASLFTQRKVRSRLAMTGEITLRGKVLPVGGIKEKILAARRHGVKELILSQRNRRDIEEIEPVYLRGLKFHFVDAVDEVIQVALLHQKVKNPLRFVFPSSS